MSNKPCLCCLVRSSDKSLKAKNTWLGNIEIYGDMLRECFKIEIEHEDETGICTICVIRLRDALEFKKQIIQCQQDFHKKLDELEAVHVKDEVASVKSEGSIEALDEAIFDDYLPEFGSDEERLEKTDSDEDYKDNVKAQIKKQSPQKKRTPLKKTAMKAKLKTEPKASISKKNAEEMISTLKSRQNVITKKTKGEPTEAETAILNTLPVSQMDKCRMSKYNLVTLVECSNCTPFMSKTAKGYNCAFCNDIIADPKILREHTHEMHRLRKSLKMHYTRRSFKIDITDLACSICDQEVPDIKSLVQHIQDLHNIPFYTEVQLDVIEFKLPADPTHIRSSYHCVFCDSSYESFHVLLQHMSVHYNNYKCEKCGKGFSCKVSLKIHMYSHETGRFSCEVCKKVFPSKWKKNYHIKHSHRRVDRNLRCPHCDETFSYYYLRNQHILTDHNIRTPYFCAICDKDFLLKSKLTNHNRIVHEQVPRFVCKTCGLSLPSKSQLKQHLVTHRGERKYKCDICTKSYGRKFTLRQHMRIHIDDRKFKCHVCQLTFVQKCTMKVHLWTQHGVKWLSESNTTAILERENETYTMPLEQIFNTPNVTVTIKQEHDIKQEVEVEEEEEE